MGALRISSPKLSQKRKSTTLRDLFRRESTFLTTVPPTTLTDSDELISMISYCTYVFTFTDPSESPSQLDLKRLKLSHILSSLRSTELSLSDTLLSPLLAMLSANLFRPLPPSAASPDIIGDDDVSVNPLAPTWPHLQLVYDILTALVAGVADTTSLSSHIDRTFLGNLLSLFQSEDPRERDRLKCVYHQLYSRLTGERAFMRRSMGHVFLWHTMEADRHCGIGDMLEIWGSIINGFSVPLKKEHREFLVRVLLPLHKGRGMPAYHRQLSYCVSQFVEKEAELGEVVMRGVLKYWPVANCPKEVLLIGQTEDMIRTLEGEMAESVAVPLCLRIARCLSSFHSQVAERALYVWNDEYFVRMVSRYMEHVFPIIVIGIEKNMKWHWNPQVQLLTLSVKKMLEEMEPGLYSKCLEDLNRRESMAGQEEVKRRERWERLEKMASDKCLI